MPKPPTREQIGPADRAVNVYVGVNHGNGLAAEAIAYLTRPPGADRHQVPSHARIGVELQDGRRLYWESLAGYGWTGPHPESKAEAWADQHPHRWLERIWIDGMNSTGRDRVLTRAQAMVEVWTYSIGQLAWIYAAIRLGVRVPRSPRTAICSEGVARVGLPTIDLTNGKAPDRCTPQDNRTAALRQAILVERYPSDHTVLLRRAD